MSSGSIVGALGNFALAMWTSIDLFGNNTTVIHLSTGKRLGPFASCYEKINSFSTVLWKRSQMPLGLRALGFGARVIDVFDRQIELVLAPLWIAGTRCRGRLCAAG
jgi:hypothetical protein